MDRNFLLVIYSSIDENVKLRFFNLSEVSKQFYSLKSSRRRDMTTITTMNDDIFIVIEK